MPGGTTTFGKDYLLDAAFAAGTQLSLFYIALMTGEPGSEDTGDDLLEPSGGSYARVSAGASATFASFNGGLVNYVTVNFPTATDTWGVMRWYALCDSLTSGELIAWGKLGAAKNVVAGGQPSFPPGAISIAAFDPIT